MVPGLRLILEILDAQSLLYLGQVTVGLRMVSEAARSFCVLHLSFATGLFGQVTVGLRMVWEAVHSFCLLHLSFVTGLFGQVMVGLRIVWRLLARSFCILNLSFATGLFGQLKARAGDGFGGCSLFLCPASFFCHWPFWTGQDSG